MISALFTVLVLLPQACNGVADTTFEEWDPTWDVTYMVPDKTALPHPARVHELLDSVPGLEAAVAESDALELDLLYVRAFAMPLEDFLESYPDWDEALLRSTKEEACRSALRSR